MSESGADLINLIIDLVFFGCFSKKVEINEKFLPGEIKFSVINSNNIYNNGVKTSGQTKQLSSLKCSDFIPSCEGELYRKLDIV